MNNGARRSEVGGWQAFRRAIRRIVGMPDYQVYVEHLQRCHPERNIPSEGQYFEEYLNSKYANGANRCC